MVALFADRFALSWSVPSLPVALQEMTPRLTAALDGDPATAVPAA